MHPSPEEQYPVSVGYVLRWVNSWRCRQHSGACKGSCSDIWQILHFFGNSIEISSIFLANPFAVQVCLPEFCRIICVQIYVLTYLDWARFCSWVEGGCVQLARLAHPVLVGAAQVRWSVWEVGRVHFLTFVHPCHLLLTTHSLSQFASKHHEQALPLSLQCRTGGLCTVYQMFYIEREFWTKWPNFLIFWNETEIAPPPLAEIKSFKYLLTGGWLESSAGPSMLTPAQPWSCWPLCPYKPHSSGSSCCWCSPLPDHDKLSFGCLDFFLITPHPWWQH